MANFPIPEIYCDCNYSVRPAANGYIVELNGKTYVFVTLKSALEFIKKCEEKKNEKR